MGYDTDISDAQWLIVRPLLPSAKPGGRPRTTNLRHVLNAIFYLIKTGCHWRLLPGEFPPWRTVYEYLKSWRDDGTLDLIKKNLFFKTRRHYGRKSAPSIAIVDSQSVKTGKTGGKRGFDGGKKIKGRKRHLVVDSLGLPMGLVVTSANLHDAAGGRLAISDMVGMLRNKTRSVKKIYADLAYRGDYFGKFARIVCGAKVIIGKNWTRFTRVFKPLPQRWVVERSFAWLLDYRRLSLDYERLTSTSEAMIWLAAIRMMLRKLTYVE